MLVTCWPPDTGHEAATLGRLRNGCGEHGGLVNHPHWLLCAWAQGVAWLRHARCVGAAAATGVPFAI